MMLLNRGNRNPYCVSKVITKKNNKETHTFEA